MTEKLSAIKGMNDILPPESARWEWLEGKVREVMARFSYRNMRTPIVEPTPLFVRGLGEVTDIVEKEMYCFEDKLNGDLLTLRPEATAGVCRAVIEHNMLYEGGKRLYYIGPMFRHERPQRGRYRQFHQVGAEARQAVVQFAGGGLRTDGDALHHADRAGIEPFLHLHHRDAGLGIAGHDGALDGGGAAPARQERGMQVEAAEFRQI